MAIGEILKINNVKPPQLMVYKYLPEDIFSKAGRNAKGIMRATRVRTAIKLELQFTYTTEDQMQTIANLLAPASFIVQYWNPRTKSVSTGTFYCGTPSFGVWRKEKNMYEPFNINLIEY